MSHSCASGISESKAKPPGTRICSSYFGLQYYFLESFLEVDEKWHLYNAGQWYTMNTNLLNWENLRELNDEKSLSLVVKSPTHSSPNNVLLTERCDPIILLLQMTTDIYNLTGFPTQLAIMVHCNDETICFQDSVLSDVFRKWLFRLWDIIISPSGPMS